MMTILACAVCVTALTHFASIAAAALRARRRGAALSGVGLPPVSIVRPVCGLDNFVEDTLRTSFELDHPEVELLFCVANPRDPVIPVVRALMRRYPDAQARLLVGDVRVSDNPKLNNCVKGWQAASHDWIVLADSNVLMPRDYIARLMAAWTADCGLVCSPPVGMRPTGFAAHLECAFLNTYQARWQLAADALGQGFAQGKTMLWRREVLERAGGIRALGAELAEDAAATKLVRAQNLVVRLVDAPFAQPLGRRGFVDVWRRQARWARLRRASFLFYFAAELASGAALPLFAAAILGVAAGWPLWAAPLALAIPWYGAEMLLAAIAGWPLSWLYPVHALLRDLLLPALWLDGLFGSDFEWRGNAMSAVAGRRAS